jgi:hypothetical protein
MVASWMPVAASYRAAERMDGGRPTLFSDGMCAVRTPDAVGFIDAAGNLAIAPQFAEARDFTHGLAAVVASYADDSGWHYIDKSGNIVIAGPFQEAWPFSS